MGGCGCLGVHSLQLHKLLATVCALHFRGITMKLLRRQFLHLAASAAASPVVSQVARAQVYPSRPVRLVVGFAPGGGNDIAARLIGHWLSERLRPELIVQNPPGAGRDIAHQRGRAAAPERATLTP